MSMPLTLRTTAASARLPPIDGNALVPLIDALHPMPTKNRQAEARLRS